MPGKIFRLTALCGLLVTLGGGLACRKPPAPPSSGFIRFVDRMTSEEVLESPLKSSENAALGENAYPVDSRDLAEAGNGKSSFGVGRKLNLGVMETDILFAPPKSVIKYRFPHQAGGILDFGIGIVRDARSIAQMAGDPEASDGVRFHVILEMDGRRKTLFEHHLPAPEARDSRTVSFSRHRLPVELKDGEATLTFMTTGAGKDFAFWTNPVYYVPRTNPLNIILVSIDTLRADHVGAYGYDKPVTPTIDALARESAVFENTFANSPWTLPSHVSLFTGLFGARHGVFNEGDKMDPQTPTLAGQLRAAGYTTRAITGGGFVGASFGFAKGFGEYHMDHGDLTDPDQAGKIGKDAVAWIKENADRPFFLFLHTYQIHSPYKSPDPYPGMFLKPDARWKTFDLNEKLGGSAGIYGRLSDGDRDNAVALYDSGIRFTDEALIKPVVETLRRLGLYDRTMIIVTSDHGEEFYDHLGWGHPHNVYDELLRVPLIIKMPGGEFGGRRYPGFVRLVDVMPTVLDVAGAPAAASPLDGANLRSVLTGKETADRVVLAELAENVIDGRVPQRLALAEGRLKLILNHPYLPEQKKFFSTPPPDFPPVELYDLDKDPREKNNLIDRPEAAARARVLLQKAREAERFIPKRGEEKIKLDKSLEDQLRTLGYIK